MSCEYCIPNKATEQGEPIVSDALGNYVNLEFHRGRPSIGISNKWDSTRYGVPANFCFHCGSKLGDSDD